MADDSNELLAIEVDADDYAEAAAGDTPSVPRTFQSEADFQLQKQSYQAKISYGNHLDEFLTVVPEMKNHIEGTAKSAEEKIRLDKKQIQLLGYVVGELYFDHKYKEMKDLCRCVSLACETDRKLDQSLAKWSDRCEQRLRIATKT